MAIGEWFNIIIFCSLSYTLLVNLLNFCEYEKDVNIQKLLKFGTENNWLTTTTLNTNLESYFEK